VSFTVTNVTRAGATYDDGANHVSSVVVSGAAGKADVAGTEVPGQLSLDQNYPNPFNPITVLQYGIPETGHVTLAVYNALGTEVARLENGVMEAGWHRTAFDGSRLSSGVYVAVIRYGGSVKTRTMLLTK
jgi:hypothetical protein